MGLKMIVSDKKFRPLFWTQFLGALNDNILKNALVVMITFKNVTIGGLDAASIVALSGGLFILPFFLFSPLAGQISDKLDKSSLVRATKILEAGIMALAAVGLLSEQFPLLLGVLFLLGVQATLFGPVKYSLLPELVDNRDLVEANAHIEVGTFLAILVGTIGGGALVGMPNGHWWIIAATILTAGFGLWSGFQVKSAGAACPDLKVSANPLPSLLESFRLLREQKAVFNSVLGISWLWFFGAAVLSTLPTYCKDFLGGGEQVATCFLAMFTIGTGAGSILCEKLSFKRVEIGLVPLGSLGMTVFIFDLFLARPGLAADPAHLLTLREFLAAPSGIRLMADFFMMSLFGGLFVLPLYTLLQDRSRPETRSRIVAGNNIINALFMVASSLTVMGFHALHFTYPQIFLALAVLNLTVAIYIYSIVPEFTLRFLAWIFARAFYRIECVGADNIPATGPAVLVCNHVSFADWLVISALVRRPVRFVMYYKFFKIPLLRYLMKQAKVVPIAGAKEDPEILNAAFEAISRELRDGELICIFPEGKITRDGEMNAFKSGVEKIIARDAVPVVPMALKGLQVSFFGYGGGKALRKMPRHWHHEVQLVVSPALQPEEASAQALQAKVVELLTDERSSA